jgi:LTXXQ motif family protein
MQKIGAYVAIAALAVTVAAPLPAAAFGFHIGPFHFSLPFYWHRHHRHPLYMRANPNDVTRREQPQQGAIAPGPASALFYPSQALPAMFQSIFWPTYSSPWPFGYENIFSTAFEKASAGQDPDQCRQSVDVNAIVGRIGAETAPNPDQMKLLQRLGGALGAASGYLARACPAEIPVQPTARLKLMESQIEELAMAIDIARPPLQDFEQSLNTDQQARLANGANGPASPGQQNRQDTPAPPCGGSPTAIDWSIDQIDKAVQPTDAQRGDLDTVRQAFNKAASDLEAHCPTSMSSSALGRLEAIQARLDATWRAVLSIQVALADFENKMSDEQKGRFDAMNFAAAR